MPSIAPIPTRACAHPVQEPQEELCARTPSQSASQSHVHRCSPNQSMRLHQRRQVARLADSTPTLDSTPTTPDCKANNTIATTMPPDETQGCVKGSNKVQQGAARDNAYGPACNGVLLHSVTPAFLKKEFVQHHCVRRVRRHERSIASSPSAVCREGSHTGHAQKLVGVL